MADSKLPKINPVTHFLKATAMTLVQLALLISIWLFAGPALAVTLLKIVALLAFVGTAAVSIACLIGGLSIRAIANRNDDEADNFVQGMEKMLSSAWSGILKFINWPIEIIYLYLFIFVYHLPVYAVLYMLCMLGNWIVSKFFREQVRLAAAQCHAQATTRRWHENKMARFAKKAVVIDVQPVISGAENIVFERDDNGDNMTVEEWMASCHCGAFIDYDGHGRYAVGGWVAKDQYCSPSDITQKGLEPPKWATHVQWYNR